MTLIDSAIINNLSLLNFKTFEKYETSYNENKEIILKEINAYYEEIINDLPDIILVDNQINICGSFNNLNIKINVDKECNIIDTLHHEIYHYIDSKSGTLYIDEEWIKINGIDEKWITLNGITRDIKTKDINVYVGDNYDKIDLKEGFIINYGMKDHGEDKATIYECIMINRKCAVNILYHVDNIDQILSYKLCTMIIRLIEKYPKIYTKITGSDILVTSGVYLSPDFKLIFDTLLDKQTKITTLLEEKQILIDDNKKLKIDNKKLKNDKGKLEKIILGDKLIFDKLLDKQTKITTLLEAKQFIMKQISSINEKQTLIDKLTNDKKKLEIDNKKLKNDKIKMKKILRNNTENDSFNFLTGCMFIVSTIIILSMLLIK